MYYLLYEENGINKWELVSGEDEMQLQVNELMARLGCSADEIIVLPADCELE